MPGPKIWSFNPVTQNLNQTSLLFKLFKILIDQTQLNLF